MPGVVDIYISMLVKALILELLTSWLFGDFLVFMALACGCHRDARNDISCFMAVLILFLHRRGIRVFMCPLCASITSPPSQLQCVVHSHLAL